MAAATAQRTSAARSLGFAASDSPLKERLVGCRTNTHVVTGGYGPMEPEWHSMLEIGNYSEIRNIRGFWFGLSVFVVRLAPGPGNGPGDLDGVTDLQCDGAEGCSGKVDPVGRVVSSLVDEAAL